MKAKKEKTEEQKAKMKMSSIKNQIRNCLASGDEKKAFALLSRNGIQDILECRLPMEYKSDAEPWFAAYVARITPPETTEQPSNGGSKDIFSPEVEATMPKRQDISDEITVLEGSTTCVTPQGVWTEPNVGDLTPLEGQDIAFPANEPRIEENESAGETLSEPAVLTANDFVLGWPKKTEAVVWGMPRNPNMAIILLPDLRKAAIWQPRHRKLRIHDKVTAQLEDSFLNGERQGDPIFVDVSKRANIW